MKFTDSQKAAISHPAGNLQLIACAGSGKTEIVARRVAYLLKTTQNLIPGNIVAFTYTEKAAAELKERIHTRCRDALGNVHGLTGEQQGCGLRLGAEVKGRHCSL